jgi:AcrR family transcriptional regulator
VREIADAAGIKHPLAHHHFGTKEAVVSAVYEQTAEEMAAIAAEINDLSSGLGRLFDAVFTHEVRYRALARAMLDGENPHRLQRDFPTIQRLANCCRCSNRAVGAKKRPLTSKSKSWRVGWRR